MVAQDATWVNGGKGLCAAVHGGPDWQASAEEVAEYLADDETFVNERSEDLSTPLHYACMGTGEDHPRICKMLLQAGADFNAKDACGRTPLHFAAALGHFEQATELLEFGADVNINNSYGSTPLHNAVLGKMERTVNLLIHRGANVRAENNGGWTPLHYAMRGGDCYVSNQLIRMLMQHVPKEATLAKLPPHPLPSDKLEPHPKELVPSKHADMI